MQTVQTTHIRSQCSILGRLVVPFCAHRGESALILLFATTLIMRAQKSVKLKSGFKLSTVNMKTYGHVCFTHCALLWYILLL